MLGTERQTYQTLLEHSPFGVAMIDKDSTYKYINPKFKELFGYDLNDVPNGREWLRKAYPDPTDRHQVIAAWLDDLKDPKPPEKRPRNFTVTCKGGNKKVIKFITVQLETGENLMTCEDITECKRAENMLRESERRFHDLAENSLTGISIIQNHQIVYRNSEYDRMMGPLPRSILDQFEKVHPEDVEKVKETYEKILSGEIRDFDIEVGVCLTGEMDPSTNVKWFHCRASVIEYQGQGAILVSMMDVTRTKELEHLVKIDDKMTSLGRIATGIIHEVRNSLSGMNIYLTALRKIYNHPKNMGRESLEKVDEIVEKLQSASNRIESVIKRVVDFSKPSTPKLTLTDVNRSIEEAINLSSTTLRKSGIKIEASLSQGLPQCFTDPHLIEQVLLNLITNAAQAMENTTRDKKIAITSARESNHIFIGVADSGPGVPLPLRNKIFEPFFTTKKDSSGIGLSLCHRIITDHGGSLGVSTGKWGGAEFRIKIPIEKRVAHR